PRSGSAGSITPSPTGRGDRRPPKSLPPRAPRPGRPGAAEHPRRRRSATTRCVESRGLGETQRAVFHYHAGLLTRRAEVHGPTGCPYLLVQQNTREPVFEPEPGWVRV